MEKYYNIIQSINNGIQEFKDHLNRMTTIPMLRHDNINDPNHYLNLTEVGWHDAVFPNENHPGLYFLFGYMKTDPKIKAVYVGKASVQSNIGSRLNSHLKDCDVENRIYEMNDKKGNTFHIEFIATLPFTEFIFFIPALEEFLIENFQNEKVPLINKVGNY